METKELFYNKYLKVFKLLGLGKIEYLVASRREQDNLVAGKSEEEYKAMLPDAVTVCLVVNTKGKSPRLYLTNEMRYPAAHYLLSPPAGLIDKEDYEKIREQAIIDTAKREIFEETGVQILDTDEFKIVSPLLFSTPGMTDESNAIVLCVLNREEDPTFTGDNAVGAESFGEHFLLSKEEAEELLRKGTDKNGMFFSVFTWVVLSVFLSEYEWL